MKTMTPLEKFKSSFESENYKEALEILETNKSSFEDNLYYFNKAVVHFRLEEFPQAKLFIEKASSLGLDSMESREIIKKSDNSLGIAQASMPETIVDNTIYYSQYVGIDILIIFFSLLFVVYLFSLKKMEGLFFKLICFGFLIIPLGYLTYSKLALDDYIALEKRSVYSGPSLMFEEDTFELPAGIKYTISKHYKKWGYILYPAKYNGWIQLSKKERI